MNTMADGARERLVAQIGEALFGQPGLTLMELAEKVKGMRSPFLIEEEPLPADMRLGSVDYLDYLNDQPSPAGQGDTETFYVCEKCNYHYHDVAVSECDCEPGASRFRKVQLFPSPIAARHPVDFDDKELQFYREHIGNNLDNMLMAAGVFEVTHEGGYEACWANSMDALKRLIDRQPVGENEKDYVEFLDRQNDSLRRAIHAIMAKLVFLLDEDQFADVDAIALAAGVSPPAQAVDLGQLQRYDLDDGWDHYRDLAKDAGAHLYEEATGEWVKWDDVRALIDSQAVGNK